MSRSGEASDAVSRARTSALHTADVELGVSAAKVKMTPVPVAEPADDDSTVQRGAES